MVAAPDQLSWLTAEWTLLGDRDERERQMATSRIHGRLEVLVREGSTEAVGRVVHEIMRRLQDAFASPTTTAEERSGALQLIETLGTMSAEEVALQLSRLVQIVHMELNRRDPVSMERAATVLGGLMAHAGILANELIEADMAAAIEAIRDDGDDGNVHLAVLIACSIVTHAPLGALQHIPPLMEQLWRVQCSSKLAIRETSARLFALCLTLLTEHHQRTPASVRPFKTRALEAAMRGLRSGQTPQMHGAILALHVLAVQCDGDAGLDYWEGAYVEAVEVLLRLVQHKDATVRHASIALTGQLAGVPEGRVVFCAAHLARWIALLVEIVAKREGDRHCALLALHTTISAVGETAIRPHLDALTATLREILLLKGRARVMDDVNAALGCVSALAETGGGGFRHCLLQLLPALTGAGLWGELVATLQRVTAAVPDTLLFMEDALLATLTTLLAEPAEGTGRRNSPPASPTSTAPESEETIALALRCVGAFDFTERVLMGALGRRMVETYLNDASPGIRIACVEGVLQMCRRAGGTPGWMVDGVVSAVLTRLVSDGNGAVGGAILRELASGFDHVLAKPVCIHPLFVFLGSNSAPLEQRWTCAALLSRVVGGNAAAVVPSYRQLLLKFLSEIECIRPQTLLRREDSARLLHRILLWPDVLIAPYVEALLRSIAPRISDPNVGFAESMLACLERIVEVRAVEAVPLLPSLLDTLDELIQDQGAPPRRRAALSALGLIICRVERRHISHDRLCTILLHAIALLKTERTVAVRHEAIRLVGIVGAVDPYLVKTREMQMLTMSDAGGDDTTRGRDDTLGTLQSHAEEFFAGIVAHALLRVLRDASLAVHHMAATQSLVYLFRTLGPRAHPFLAPVLPVLHPIVRGCPATLGDFYFHQLATIVGVVGVHIRPRVAEIMGLVRGMWQSHAGCQPAMLHLVDRLVHALKGEFRPHVHLILPQILQLLAIDAARIAARPYTIQKALQSLAVLGTQVSDYAGIVGDTLAVLLGQSQLFRDVRIATLRTTASICKDVAAVADNPAIFQGLVAVLALELESEREGERGSEMRHRVEPQSTQASSEEKNAVLECCLDAIVVVALAQGRSFFRFLPLLGHTVMGRTLPHHPAFERLLVSNLNSPAKLAELASESLQLLESKVSDLTLASAPGDQMAIGRRPPLNEVLLRKSWDLGGCVSRDDWFEWIRRLGIELLRESPSPALRSCATLAHNYYPLGKELFNAAFASCFAELGADSQDSFIATLETALANPVVPSEVIQTLLNLAEFMEREERPLPIDIRTLGTYAARCHAFAKALYYKEQEFLTDVPGAAAVEALISINNQIQQPDAALGILVYAHKTHGIVLKESWYEKLQRWDEALRAYEAKWQANPTSFDAVFGILRCRHALGEWDELNGVAQHIWPTASEQVRGAIGPLAAASAWGLHDWSHMEQYVQALRPDSPDSVFFRAILSIQQRDMAEARQLIQHTRNLVDTELTALLSESYSRAYNTVVRVQMLTELEEVADYLEKTEGQARDDPAAEHARQVLLQSWTDRLQLSQHNVEIWLRILKVRSLVMTPESDPTPWIRFVSMCRKGARPHLAHKILRQLLNQPRGGVSLADELAQLNVVTANPHVVYAFLKYAWECGAERLPALHMMRSYARLLTQALDRPGDASSVAAGVLVEPRDDMLQLLARCYYKASKWERQLLGESNGAGEESFKVVLDGYLSATAFDKTWHKAWHGWALTNFEMAVLWEKGQMQAAAGAVGTVGSPLENSPGGHPGHTGHLGPTRHPGSTGWPLSGHSPQLSHNTSPSLTSLKTRINPYIVPAIQGFFRSISLSTRNSLQDSLRLLTLWFKYGSSAEINAAVGDGFYSVPVDNWLQVIPQLIARIHVASLQVRRLVHHVLSDIGRHHPQSLVYSLTVASKSQNVARRSAAVTILDKMRSHSATLVDQVLLVGQELIRVAILWDEMWHEGLEEASKLYFGEHNIPTMFSVLEPLHQMIEKGSSSAREALFIQSYGHELREARELGLRYKRAGNPADLNAAWDLYYQVFRRINKSLPRLTYLALDNVSPRLLKCQDLEAAIPGTYQAGTPVIRISSICPRIDVIASKQRPRKLVMLGSDGQQHQFLLKGHEDLRQDERVMQLFGLVNTLLANDPETHKRHLKIVQFSVIPLSQNTGLIGWLPHCDTLHTLIKDYRETRGMPLSLEHRAMLQFAPDYDHLTRLQKMEVFDTAMRSSESTDLARIFWLKSRNAESWFERRTTYGRSLAVMSMVGYVLGLGDRHPSNLLIDQVTGRIVHIDFGDCFEVAMHRERFPEKVPFRLTRMLVRAMEVSGVEGTFRITCEETMRVLRSNKDSLMAVLEAFVYDPLINWRLLAKNLQSPGTDHIGGGDSSGNPSVSLAARDEAGSWAQFPDHFSTSRKIRRDSEISKLEEESLARPDALNSGALSVINRVSSKLTGRDFRPKKRSSAAPSAQFTDFSRATSLDSSDVHEWPLAVPSQVDRLVHEATRIDNLCQAYVGWCPFW